MNHTPNHLLIATKSAVYALDSSLELSLFRGKIQSALVTPN